MLMDGFAGVTAIDASVQHRRLKNDIHPEVGRVPLTVREHGVGGLASFFLARLSLKTPLCPEYTASQRVQRGIVEA